MLILCFQSIPSNTIFLLLRLKNKEANQNLEKYRIFPTPFCVSFNFNLMATLKLTIFKAKVLKDGRHKIRIAVCHKHETAFNGSRSSTFPGVNLKLRILQLRQTRKGVESTKLMPVHDPINTFFIKMVRGSSISFSSSTKRLQDT